MKSAIVSLTLLAILATTTLSYPMQMAARFAPQAAQPNYFGTAMRPPLNNRMTADQVKQELCPPPYIPACCSAYGLYFMAESTCHCEYIYHGSLAPPEKCA